MTENQIDEFICLIQKNGYEVKQIKYDKSYYKKVLTVESNCFLVPRILIPFTDLSRTKGKEYLEEVAVLNKQINNNKPTIVIIIITMESELGDMLWFNDSLYVHLLVYNEKFNCIYFDKDFHYFGAKRVRKLINILKQSIN